MHLETLRPCRACRPRTSRSRARAAPGSGSTSATPSGLSTTAAATPRGAAAARACRRPSLTVRFDARAISSASTGTRLAITGPEMSPVDRARSCRSSTRRRAAARRTPRRAERAATGPARPPLNLTPIRLWPRYLTCTPPLIADVEVERLADQRVAADRALDLPVAGLDRGRELGAELDRVRRDGHVARRAQLDRVRQHVDLSTVMRIRFSFGKTAGSGWKSGWKPPSVAIRYGVSPQLERTPPSPRDLEEAHHDAAADRRVDLERVAVEVEHADRVDLDVEEVSRARGSLMSQRAEQDRLRRALVSCRTRRSRRSRAGRGTRRPAAIHPSCIVSPRTW